MTTDKIADIAGLPIHYREAGEGKTIVFLHGAGGAPPAGASFAPRLAERHRLLIPSRPGFDETPLGSCKTARDAADAMAGFIRATVDGKAHVVAQSAGGAVGCWLAILYPDLVETLVLSAPAAFAHHRPSGPPPAREQLDLILYGEHPDWSGPPTELERQRIQRNAQAYMAWLGAAGADAELEGRLAEIKAPALLIVATHDRLVPEAAMAPYQRHIPSCLRIFIHGAAHEMPIAACAAWVKLVAAFVDRGERFVVNTGDED